MEITHINNNKKRGMGNFKKKLKKNWPFLVMLMIPLIFLLVFSYGPMYGVSIAFKRYSPGLGIWDSPWNQFGHFKRMMKDTLFIRALKNTLNISFLKLLIGFPAPIILALALNEIRFQKFKKLAQTISYLPYFLSWVIAAAMLIEILSPDRGLINSVLKMFGMNPVHFLANKNTFIPVLIISEIWKSIGYESIIYLAAITGVDLSIYEAAELDGASRLQKMWHVTIPSIMPIILVMLILRLGQVLNAGFDQVLNLYNPSVYAVADIIDTYVYRIGLENFSFDYSTAVGLVKNLVGLVLILTSNLIVKKTTGQNVI